MVGANAPAIVFRWKAVSSRLLTSMTVAVLLVAVSALGTSAPRLVWNASTSVPTGLYGVVQGSPRIGDVALAALPSAIALLAARRGYLPQRVFLLKPVIAIAGDRVCRLGAHIFVRGEFAALARLSDEAGQPLPVWSGCHLLVAGEVFLLADHPDSFDSRYFGPLDHQHIKGRAFLIW